MARPETIVKQNAAVKEAIVKEENLIYLSLKCEYESAHDYLVHMRKKYRVIFGDEEEEIIHGLNFEEYYGKTLQVLVVKGAVFQGLYMFICDTLRGAELLGYGKPPIILGCLLFEKALEDKRFHDFRFIVPVSDEVPDSVNVPCLLCIANEDQISLEVYYDEPIAGLYANAEDAYAFTSIPMCP